jgi:hypothetical protein
MDRHNGMMVKLGGASGFAQKPVAIIDARETATAGNLDRNGAIELRVAGLVYRAKRADADRRE